MPLKEGDSFECHWRLFLFLLDLTLRMALVPLIEFSSCFTCSKLTSDASQRFCHGILDKIDTALCLCDMVTAMTEFRSKQETQ